MNMPKSRDIQAKIPLPQAIWNEFWLQRFMIFLNPDDLVVEGGVVDSEEKAEDADAAATEDSDAASDDTKDAETTEEPEETEAADAE